MKILRVPTSHDALGDTGRKTGFWLEDFAGPWIPACQGTTAEEHSCFAETTY